MIVRSGRTGPGFDSRNGPFFKTGTSMTHEGDPWLNRANFNFKTISVCKGFHMSDLKKFSRFVVSLSTSLQVFPTGRVRTCSDAFG